MKSIISKSILCLIVSGFSVVGSATLAVKEVNIAVHDAFIPDNIQSGVDAKIVVSGMLPNSCYTWSRTAVVHPQPFLHEVRAMAMLTTDSMCLMVLVPFSKEVNLGSLQQGEHTVRFISGDGTFFERKFQAK